MGTHILNDAADPSVKACEVLVAHGSVDIVSEVVEALADNLVLLHAGAMGWGGWRGGRGVWGVGAGAKVAETHCNCSLSCSAYMASTSTSVKHYCVAQRSLPCTQGCIEHTAWGRGEFIWVLGRLQAGWPPGKRQRSRGGAAAIHACKLLGRQARKHARCSCYLTSQFAYPCTA